MTTNTFINIDMVTNEALIVLENKLAMGKRVLRKWDDYFGNSRSGSSGGKIGDTLRLRKPARFISTTGAAPAAQNYVSSEIAVTTATQRNVMLSFTTKDMALSMDNYSDNVLAPVMAQLASDIDQDIMSVITGYTSNSVDYGGAFGLITPGTVSTSTGPAAWTGATFGAAASTPAAAMAPFYQAQAMLTNQAAPREDRYTVLSPDAMAAAVPQLNTIFNPSGAIGKQYEQGVIGMLAGSTFFESPNVPYFTSGNWTGNPGAVATTSVNGATTIALKNFTDGDTFVVGDQFVIGGVFSVNPLNRKTTGQLQVFTVRTAATAAGGGLVTLNVYPSIFTPTSQSATVDSLPQANAVVTMMGTANTSTAINFTYQKNAIGFVVAALDTNLHGALVSTSNDPELGLGVRFVQQYNSQTDQDISRLDILYGVANIRPELIIRLQS